MPIQIKTLKKISDNFTTKNHVFKDLALDIKLNNIETPGFTSNVPGKDIKNSLDGKAVVNSLLNLFNTRPGQRFLFPLYGIKLHRRLFEPVTEINAKLIGDEIVFSAENFEPRIKVNYINAKINAADNAYTFDIFYDVPLLNLSTNTSFFIESQAQIFTVLSIGNKK